MISLRSYIQIAFTDFLSNGPVVTSHIQIMIKIPEINQKMLYLNVIASNKKYVCTLFS